MTATLTLNGKSVTKDFDLIVIEEVSATPTDSIADAIAKSIDTDGNVLVTNIGSYDATKGEVTLTGFSPTSISSGNTYLRIFATPADDNNIKPLRAHVIDLGFNVVKAETDTNQANAISGVTD